MKQKEIQTIPQALDVSATAIAGATATGTAIGLKLSTAEVITTERTALVNANNAHKEGKVALDLQRAAYYSVLAMVILFVTTLRDVFRTHLGTRHNESWDAVGFVRSLAIRVASPDCATSSSRRRRTWRRTKRTRTRSCR